jgi:hypothetical protein
VPKGAEEHLIALQSKITRRPGGLERFEQLLKGAEPSSDALEVALAQVCDVLGPERVDAVLGR